jgi:hypothetical protein
MENPTAAAEHRLTAEPDQQPLKQPPLQPIVEVVGPDSPDAASPSPLEGTLEGKAPTVLRLNDPRNSILVGPTV